MLGLTVHDALENQLHLSVLGYARHGPGQVIGPVRDEKGPVMPGDSHHGGIDPLVGQVHHLRGGSVLDLHDAQWRMHFGFQAPPRFQHEHIALVVPGYARWQLQPVHHLFNLESGGHLDAGVCGRIIRNVMIGATCQHQGSHKQQQWKRRPFRLSTLCRAANLRFLVISFHNPLVLKVYSFRN